MNAGAVPSNPFVAGGMLENPELFVGRKDELHAIASRMSGVQPTSLNVVGEKRIGKSSLLYHFFQTWEQRVQDPSRYVVIYLSLQSVVCQREEDFYVAVAQELLRRPAVRAIPSLMTALQLNPLNRLAFSTAIALFKNQIQNQIQNQNNNQNKNNNQNLLPVLCLDDFKTLFENKSEFDDGFFNNLRSLMDSNSLMLVIASQKELDFYARRHQMNCRPHSKPRIPRIQFGEFCNNIYQSYSIRDRYFLVGSTLLKKASLSCSHCRSSSTLSYR